MWRWQLKVVEVITVAHVDDEKRVDNSLVQIWKVNFGHKVKLLFGLWGQGFKVCSRFWSWCSGKILKLNFGFKVKFLLRLWRQVFKVWSRFWSWCSGKILKLNFGHYFAADAWLWLWSSFLVEILKLGLVKILKFNFWRNAEVWLRFWSWCLVEILKMIDQDLCKNLWYDLK